MRLPSVSIEGDAVSSNSFYLHWTGLVAGVIWPVEIETFFFVGRAFVRFVSIAALITSRLLGSAVCLNAAVALTDTTSPNLSVEINLNYTWGLVLKTFTPPRKSRLSLVSRQVKKIFTCPKSETG